MALSTDAMCVEELINIASDSRDYRTRIFCSRWCKMEVFGEDLGLQIW